jgi:glucans biosynthesis protein
MSAMLDRRQFLLLSAALAAAGQRLPAALAADQINFGPAEPFSFEGLISRARELAGTAFVPPVIRHPDVLEAIDYDAYQQIQFRKERGLGADGSVNFPFQFFHLGRYFKAPVRLHALANGQAREILYSPDYFTFGKTDLAAKLPADLGFAGFRVMNDAKAKRDWLAFLGAAYFRSSGELDQYGLSARGVAIDVAMPTPEEFPRFTEFWLEPGPPAGDQCTIYALMDGPSIAGAYRLHCTRAEKVLIDVDAELFARADIARMGVAPLTSMYWFSEHDRHLARDWRPEIHDSDGLAIWTGAGERLWRPLNNPRAVLTNSFADASPKGFGLLQRDRHFYSYEDDGVFYDRRPTVWVEPRGEWGEGAVQLVEIPTDDEIHDNIVAYWLPAAPVKAGSAWSFAYRLHWVGAEPFPPAVGRVIGTRLGRGGVPGQPRPEGARKFVIDFAGGPLAGLAKADPVEPVVTAARGKVDYVYALQVVGTTHWRAFFDLYVDGAEPVDLRCYLRLADRTLTETWLYQYLPFDYG